MLSEHVSITITSANVNVQRLGFGIPLILSCNAAFGERVRSYLSIESVAADFASDTPEYLAANALFSQEPAPQTVMIGRAVGKPTLAYRGDVVAAGVVAGNVYGIDVAGPGITATEVRYTALADITFTTTHATETFTSVAHGMLTGAGPFRVSNSGGGLPAGISVDTDYWIIRLTADTFQLATSRANALAETELLITSDGTGTHTLRRAQNDVVVAQLVQGLNDVVGNNYTAAQVTGAGETDYFTVTADSAGAWFSLATTDNQLLGLQMTHAEPATTIATDLTAIRAANDSWYMLYTLYNSDAYVKAAAAAIEPLTKIYGADLHMSESATLADGGGDTGDDLQALNYDRTFTTYHPSPLRMAGAAWAGTKLPIQPGATTWMDAQPDGVPVFSLTDTHATNLVAKNINFIQTTAGVDAMREGKMVGGEFIDVIRDLDYLKNDIQVSIYELIAAASKAGRKIPMTNAGIAQVEAVLRGCLLRAVAMGIIDADFEITVPRVSAISTSNRGLRKLPDVKFNCRLQGAIHRVEVTGVVSV